MVYSKVKSDESATAPWATPACSGRGGGSPDARAYVASALDLVDAA